jgi:ApaG protein
MSQHAMNLMFEETTHDINIRVVPVYLDEHSEPDEHTYVWAYHVHIENLGTRTVQLLNRYWKITDALGKVEEVSGPGVVGEQPVLQPGEAYEYTSGCPLTTPSGFMVGHYEMTTEDGELFKVAIPAFALDMPDRIPAQLN